MCTGTKPNSGGEFSPTAADVADRYMGIEEGAEALIDNILYCLRFWVIFFSIFSSCSFSFFLSGFVFFFHLPVVI